MWWAWQLIMENGCSFMNGSSFSKASFALDSAMNSALFKANPIAEIKVYVTK